MAFASLGARRIFVAILSALPATAPALAQSPTAVPTDAASKTARSTVTPAEAQKALKVLQDAGRRDALYLASRNSMNSRLRWRRSMPASKLTVPWRLYSWSRAKVACLPGSGGRSGAVVAIA
jgi:hypothetical protein